MAEMPPDTKIRLRLRPGLFSPMETKPGDTPKTVVEFHTFPTPCIMSGLEHYKIFPTRSLCRD